MEAGIAGIVGPLLGKRGCCDVVFSKPVRRQAEGQTPVRWTRAQGKQSGIRNLGNGFWVSGAEDDPGPPSSPALHSAPNRCRSPSPGRVRSRVPCRWVEVLGYRHQGVFLQADRAACQQSGRRRVDILFD